tara:strand:- start:20 stop:355 length:336 start_codon:yes stop_codon:yes gene_type:complete
MSISPGTYNITLYKRSDWSKEFILKDPNGTAVNLTTFSAACEFWTVDRTKKWVDVNAEITDAANGKVKLSLTDTQTATLPDTSYYDLKMTSGDISDYWLTGTVTAKIGYTT